MSDKPDIEAIMEVIEQVYDANHELIICNSEMCLIVDLSDKVIIQFSNLSNLYRWTTENQDKLDEQRKEQIKQQAEDYKSLEPGKHLW